MLACDTKIYKDVFTLAKILFAMTAKFKRDYKASIAKRIEDEVLKLGDHIVAANTFKDERSEILLEEFTPTYERLQFLINIAVATNQITLRQQAHISRFMVGIGKQATNWRKSAEKRKKPNGPVSV